MIAYCCAYTGAFWMNWPLFLYYPLHGSASWGPRSLNAAGPAMAWYGLLADAAIVATVAASCVPDRVLGRQVRNRLWIFPLGAIVGCVVLLRQFFF
jgi:hypothetical protein